MHCLSVSVCYKCCSSLANLNLYYVKKINYELDKLENAIVLGALSLCSSLIPHSAHYANVKPKNKWCSCQLSYSKLRDVILKLCTNCLDSVGYEYCCEAVELGSSILGINAAVRLFNANLDNDPVKYSVKNLNMYLINLKMKSFSVYRLSLCVWKRKQYEVPVSISTSYTVIPYCELVSGAKPDHVALFYSQCVLGALCACKSAK